MMNMHCSFVTTALKAWDRIEKLGNRVELYLKVKQGQRESFSDFLQKDCTNRAMQSYIIRKWHEGPLAGPHDEHGPIICIYCGNVTHQEN